MAVRHDKDEKTGMVVVIIEPDIQERHHCLPSILDAMIFHGFMIKGLHLFNIGDIG